MIQRCRRCFSIRQAAVFDPCTKFKQFATFRYLLIGISCRTFVFVGGNLTPRSLVLSLPVKLNSIKPEPSERASTAVHDLIKTMATTNSRWLLLILLLFNPYDIVLYGSIYDSL
jgi:hypothetical protein